MENKIFKSGNEIRLARLFDNDIKLIIPDLQRDYCWGSTVCQNEVDKTLAERYAETLLEAFRNKPKESLSCGLIYGYEVPAGHIQLCDGQQRITTLYLILGILNRRTRTLGDRLISQRELDDNNEPYLQYSIRESSLYFITDLVNYFFLSDNPDLHDSAGIRKESWYFKDYDCDPTVQSILAALGSIEKVLSALEGEEAYHFAYYLCHNVRFIYYDMQTRRQGEETFVIINTKGEPLSPTENIKPSFIDAFKDEQHSEQQVSDEWEKWETYFWQHRCVENHNDTADAGMAEFFRWLLMLKFVEKDYKNSKDEKLKDEYDKLRQQGIFRFHLSLFSYDELTRYFEIVQNLFGSVDYLNKDMSKLLSPDAKRGVNQMDWFRLLPLILYSKRFPDASAQEIKRFSEFLKHTSSISLVRKNIQDVLPSLLEGVAKMDRDILSLQNQGVSAMLFTPEVNEKFKLCRDAKNRNKFEQELWKAEDDGMWCGEIQPLLDWAKRSGVFNLNDFIKYRDIFVELFANGHNLDLLRRLLLVKNPDGYPCHCETFVRMLTNYTFGLEAREWREIIENMPSVFDGILWSLNGVPSQDIDANLEAQVLTGLPNLKDDDKRLIASCNDYLAALNNKYIQYWNNDADIALIQGKRSNCSAYLHSFEWKLFVEDLIAGGHVALPAGWSIEGYYWYNNGGCTYFHYLDAATNILYCIDVAWRPYGYNVDYFCKSNGTTETDCKDRAVKNLMRYYEQWDSYTIKLPGCNTKQQILNYVLRLMQC